MKKRRIAFLAAVMVMVATITGCGNRQMLDVTYTFDRAIVKMPDGEVLDVKIDSWKDYEDGDQIQIKVDGVTYLVHSANVVLIAGTEDK